MGKRVLFRKHDGRPVRAPRLSVPLLFTPKNTFVKHSARIRHTAMTAKEGSRGRVHREIKVALVVRTKARQGFGGAMPNNNLHVRH